MNWSEFEAGCSEIHIIYRSPFIKMAGHGCFLARCKMVQLIQVFVCFLARCKMVQLIQSHEKASTVAKSTQPLAHIRE